MLYFGRRGDDSEGAAGVRLGPYLAAMLASRL